MYREHNRWDEDDVRRRGHLKETVDNASKTIIHLEYAADRPTEFTRYEIVGSDQGEREGVGGKCTMRGRMR